MTWVLYALEAVLAVWVAAVLAGVGLWVYRLCVGMPVWLPVVAVGLGFMARLSWEWSLVSWVVGWHGVIARRIEER